MNPSPASKPLPLELPGLVMRRAAWVMLAVMACAAALGAWRSVGDIDEETRSALALAQTMAWLMQEAPKASNPDAALRLAPPGELRHVRLTLRDAQARVVFDSAGPGLGSTPNAATHTVSLPQADGRPWVLDITASRDSERREASAGLLQMLALLAAGGAAMLAVMAWNVRRAFAPLKTLVAAIDGLRVGQGTADTAALAARMPIRELQTIAQAVHELQGALDAEAARRRVLSRQMLSLQEEERERLAHELHDEFGQQLTAMRVDAIWLVRQCVANDEPARVAQAIADRCGGVQQDIRSLLHRLRPLAPDDGDESAHRLAELLNDLVQGWARSAAAPAPCIFELNLVQRTAAGDDRPWPVDGDGQALMLPRALVLVLYRISQEALTNVARHALATRATLLLRLELASDARARALEWSVCDNGVGLDDAAQALQRGVGLAGVKERIWAWGADWQLGPASADAARPGLRLAARFELERVA